MPESAVHRLLLLLLLLEQVPPSSPSVGAVGQLWQLRLDRFRLVGYVDRQVFDVGGRVLRAPSCQHRAGRIGRGRGGASRRRSLAGQGGGLRRHRRVGHVGRSRVTAVVHPSACAAIRAMEPVTTEIFMIYSFYLTTFMLKVI